MPKTAPADSVPPSSTVDVASPSQGPPPEAKQSLWSRRHVILSFWLVAVLLGLPIWWKTTAIYRAELPLQIMMDWAEVKVGDFRGECPALPINVP